MVGYLILLVFFVFAALMISNKLPALIAIPAMGIVVGLVAQLPSPEIQKVIVEEGVARLSGAYVACIFGAILGQIMLLTGISEKIIKKAAEFGGDNPVGVLIAMYVAVALLFTTLAGLGAVIMVGNIALPIMLSVGLPPLTVATVYLFGVGTGMGINLANWAYWKTVTGVTLDDVKVFALAVAGLTVLTAFVFIYFQARKSPRIAWASVASSMAQEEAYKYAPWYSLITPIVPIILVVFFKWQIVSAFIAGIGYAVVTTYRRGTNSSTLIGKAAYKGVADAAPAVLLMIGIGILLKAVSHPVVGKALAPILNSIVPTSFLGYVVFFALLSPLALYRGPMNLYGLGSGVASLMVSLKILSPMAVTAGFLCTERVQIIGDPTNTHNVWTAGFTGVDVNRITAKVIPFIWLLSAASAVLAGLMYMR
ncbi:MAG: C4-dicarboxylate ABC transporter [Firmicutes bacterium]|nr:C4-dicarboxylate ABC transporter [Bacillota bacterium]